MVIFGGSSGIRRHNDTYEFRFNARMPPCTLARDMVALLEKSQADEAWRAICDVVLVAGTLSLYCHAHMLAARCTRLAQRVAMVAPKGSYWTMLSNPNPTMQDGLDDLLRDVVDDVGPIRVQLDCSPSIAWNLLHYVYSDEPAYGNLSMTELYHLFLAAQTYELPQLAARCYRQIKVRMDVRAVIPILKLANNDGAYAIPVQELCKYFFMINYAKCSELEECESLDPRQLCELMRLNNSRRNSRDQEDNYFRMHQDPSQQPSTLQSDMRKLYVNGVFPDFEVVVEGEIIKVHKFILAARCNYFASCLLTSGMAESRSSRLVIPSQTAMITSAFLAFLRFVYAGDDVVKVLVPQTAMYLVEAAQFYGLTNNRLQHFCEGTVRQHFNERHVLQIFEASCKLEQCEAIKAMALEFIVANFHRIGTQSEYLRKLDKALLLEILEGLAARTGGLA